MRLSLLVLFACCLLAPARAAVVEDFEGERPYLVERAEEYGGRFDRVPAGEGRAARVSWAPEHRHYLELHSPQAAPLPLFDDGVDGVLAVDVYTDTPAPITHLSLRLVDAEGEVHQMQRRVELPAGVWHELLYTLSPEAFTGHWGGDDDKRIDLPVRLLGFAVGLRTEPATAGALLIDNVRAFTAGRPVPARRPLWHFDDRDRWRMHPMGREFVTMVPGDGLRLEVAPTDQDRMAPLYEARFGVRPLGDPDELRLRAALDAGDGVGLGLRLVDRGGEVFTYPTQMLEPGENAIVWDLRAPQEGSYGENVDGTPDPPLKLWELNVIRRAGAPAAVARLLSAEVAAREPALQTLSFDVETGNPIHVLKVGEEERLRFRVDSRALVPLAAQVALRLTPFDGEPVTLRREVDLEAGGSVTWQPDWRPPSRGVWWVDVTFETEDSIASQQRSFAVMDPAGPTPGRAEGFLFGVCTHTERWPKADRDKEVLAAALCGAKVVRTAPGWPGVQPERDRWSWELMDEIVDAYGAAGMEIQYLLGFTPRWAALPERLNAEDWREWGMGPPADLDAWASYCATMARRYGDRIRYWEVWNEPDIGFWRGTLDEYLVLLERAYKAIKGVDPDLQVMTGGFAIYHRNPAFIHAVVERGQDWFDIFAYHRHGAYLEFADEVDGPVARLREQLRGDKELYFNETALASIAGGERVQAEALIKKLVFSWSRGSIGYTWYDLRNDGFDPDDWEHTYGMVTNDFYPKAVYPAYNTLAALLGEQRYEGELDLGPGARAFAFANDAEQVVVAWSDQPAADGVRIVSTDATAAAVVDAMGNREPVAPIPGGRVLLPVGGTPRYLVLTGASRPARVEGPLAAYSGEAWAVPGRELALEATWTNPFAEPATLALETSAPPGWRTSLPATLELPANGRATTTLRASVPAGETGRLGSRRELTLRYRFADGPLAGALRIPVGLAAVVTPGTERAPDLVINRREQVTARFAADPHKRHLLWQNAGDASAEVWLRREGESLVAEVRVRDDRVVAPAEGPGGDRLWLALARPGGEPWRVEIAARPNGATASQEQVRVETRTTDQGLTYTVALPLAAAGLDPSALAQGVRLQLGLTDDDGEGPESDLLLAPADPAAVSDAWPLVVFADE